MKLPMDCPPNVRNRVTPSGSEAAYLRVLPELEALDPAQVRTLSLDLRQAATTVLGAVYSIRFGSPELFPPTAQLDAAFLDRLTDLAHGALHADALRSTTTLPPNELPQLRKEAVDLRAALVALGALHVKQGIFRGRSLRHLRGPVGYQNLSSDLFTLVTLFRRHEAELAGKCSIGPATLARAAALSGAIHRELSQRGRNRSSLDEATEVRRRALWLLATNYDQLRHFVGYLRWHHGDANRIAPSLYEANGRRKKRHAPVAEASWATEPNRAPPVSGAPRTKNGRSKPRR